MSINRTVAYVRVSTDDQAASGLGMEAQIRKIEAAAVVQDLNIVETIIDDGQSGKTLNRPGVARLLEMAGRGEIDGVIIMKLDRLTRSVADLGRLLDRFTKQGIRLISCSESIDTESAGGRLVMNVLGSVAQWEREVIAERTSDALQAKRARGERFSRHAPHGYDYRGGKLVKSDREQKIAAAIQKIVADDATLSSREIARRVTGAGHRNRNGNAISHKTVSSIRTRIAA
jgi:DNA invertase Pin-like site-specific DNA recombinase